MKKIIYILGQARCGSTALGLALGNHKGVLNLGESSRWMWGMIDAKHKAFPVDFSCVPKQDVWIDTSKSFWRLGQWRKTGYDVRVLWLKRPLWQCIRSRIRRERPDLSIMGIILWSLACRGLNWAYLHFHRIPHCVVRYSDLRRNCHRTRIAINDFTGERFDGIYDTCDVCEQRVMTGNIRTLGKQRMKLA